MKKKQIFNKNNVFLFIPDKASDTLEEVTMWVIWISAVFNF